MTEIDPCYLRNTPVRRLPQIAEPHVIVKKTVVVQLNDNKT